METKDKIFTSDNIKTSILLVGGIVALNAFGGITDAVGNVADKLGLGADSVQQKITKQEISNYAESFKQMYRLKPLENPFDLNYLDLNMDILIKKKVLHIYLMSNLTANNYTAQMKEFTKGWFARLRYSQLDIGGLIVRLKCKMDVSKLAKYYNVATNEDLYKQLIQSLSEEELGRIFVYIKNLPMYNTVNTSYLLYKI